MTTSIDEPTGGGQGLLIVGVGRRNVRCPGRVSTLLSVKVGNAEAVLAEL